MDGCWKLYLAVLVLVVIMSFNMTGHCCRLQPPREGRLDIGWPLMGRNKAFLTVQLFQSEMYQSPAAGGGHSETNDYRDGN